jgi:hypothetical protein
MERKTATKSAGLRINWEGEGASEGIRLGMSGPATRNQKATLKCVSGSYMILSAR